MGAQALNEERQVPDDRPIGASDRIATLDFIRGIAVLGILFANIVGYGHPQLAYSWPPAIPGHGGDADKALWLTQFLLIDGKMRGLFALLFGAGMVLFMDRTWARGGTRWLQARRLAWLLAFGLAHFFLLFWGDILYLYALAGLAVLPMVKWSAPVLLRVGIAWYLAGAILLTASLTGPLVLEQDPAARAEQGGYYAVIAEAWDERVEASQRELAAFSQGNYAAELSHVAQHQSYLLGEYPIIGVLETIPLMLIGMALFRLGLFSGGIDPGRLRRWGWAGVISGLVLLLPLGLWVMAAGFPAWLTQFVTSGAARFGALPMILGLAALLAAWAPAGAGSWLGERLIAAGRMAFSNYIGTSFVMMLVFRHWAGGLFGEMSRPELMAAMILGWALMLGWSKPWLERYRYGPLEWIWRCLTYWRIFPFRR